MKKLFFLFAFVVFAFVNVNGQEYASSDNEISLEYVEDTNEEGKVLSIISNSKRINKHSTKNDLNTLKAINKELSEQTKGTEVAIEAVKYKTQFVIITSNFKDTLTVYFFDSEKKLKEKYLFGVDFQKKLKTIHLM